MEIEFSLDNIEEAAKKFFQATEGHKLFAFEGTMGSGKTTFIAELCRQLGVDDYFGSPTFSIVNEYAGQNREQIYHFDFYRIENPQEAIDMGAEDYFYSGSFCFMEWPDKIGNLLPEETRRVKISVMDNGNRKLEII